MRLRTLTTNSKIELSESQLFRRGGEAEIYEVPYQPHLLAKIYREPSKQREEKLRAMLALRPAVADLRFLVWPRDLLCRADASKQVVGFLMRRVTKAVPLLDLYNPRRRSVVCPGAEARHLIRTGISLATAMAHLHRRSICIGDVNELNILVKQDFTVRLIDTDSFQFTTAGRIYYCNVGRAEFTPPELQGRHLTNLPRSDIEDRFGLAVLLFRLLMHGRHPFDGCDLNCRALEERIAHGRFPYTTPSPTVYSPPPGFSLLALPPEIRTLFVTCFRQGHQIPKSRPPASDWAKALFQLEATTPATTTRHKPSLRSK